MGGKPEVVCNDNEPAFSSTKVQQYFKEHNFKHIITLNHAAVAERSIRTIKDLI